MALSNAYVPERERGADRTFIRIADALASDAALNILREYWPEVLRKAAQPCHRQDRSAGAPLALGVTSVTPFS